MLGAAGTVRAARLAAVSVLAFLIVVTSAQALEWVPLAALQEHAVDVPTDPGQLAD